MPAQRQILSASVLALVEQGKSTVGPGETDANRFVDAAVEARVPTRRDPEYCVACYLQGLTSLRPEVTSNMADTN